MNSHALLLYVLKSIFISGIFVSYYWIALRNKNFNYYNRFYLLLSMACSVIVPLFNFNWLTIEKQALPVSSETFNFIITQTNNSSLTLSWQDIVVYITIAISLLLLALSAFNVFKVFQLKRNSAIVKMEGVDFIYTDLQHAPFSFFNTLFWKESIPLHEDYGRKILKHEITHIRQKHTIDILYCQIINAIFWMNPFYWLIQKELKAIHEFIADKEAVGKNNVEEFVKLLLQVHYGKHFLNPTHAFYYSSIKRRLFMLTTKSKTTFSYARKLLVLPVALVVVGALSVSTIESKANAFIAPVITAQQADIPSQVQQPDVPSQVQQRKVSNSVPAKQPAKRISKNDTTPTPAKAKEQPVLVKPEADVKGDKMTITADTIIIRKASDKNKMPENVLYYINDKLATYEEVSKLNPGQIKKVTVYKGDEATKKYGKAGTDGVIEVTTKLVL
jgi:hypothetical protein